MPFKIVRNDLTKMQVDAIVNTANPSPTYSTGTDSAVYKAVGEELLAARHLMIWMKRRILLRNKTHFWSLQYEIQHK